MLFKCVSASFLPIYCSSEHSSFLDGEVSVSSRDDVFSVEFPFYLFGSVGVVDPERYLGAGAEGAVIIGFLS